MRTAAENATLPEAARAAVEALDISRIRADIERLCVQPRNSLTHPEFHAEAAEFIAGELSEAGCEVTRHEFTVPSEPEPRPGLNVIGTLGSGGSEDGPAHEMPAVLIGAHYDTVPGSSGADDDASGVAVMLECARALSSLERRRPIKFVAFDAEERQPEVGLHGSTAYVRDLCSSGDHGEISAVYILEMVGYSAPAGAQRVPTGLQLLFPRAFDALAGSGFSGDSVVAISDWRSRDASRALEDASRGLEDGIPVLPIEIPRWMPVPHNLRRSDHAPFWSAGIPAVMIGDTANFRNPHYHEPTDTPDTLDYEFIERVAKTVIATVAIQASAPEPVRKRRVRLR